MDLIKLSYLSCIIFNSIVHKHRLNVKLHISWSVAGNIIYYLNHSTYKRTLFCALFSLSIILFWTCLFRHFSTMIVFYTINIFTKYYAQWPEHLVEQYPYSFLNYLFLHQQTPNAYCHHIALNSTYIFEQTFKISLFIFTAKEISDNQFVT